jgi:hypothetical protein
MHNKNKAISTIDQKDENMLQHISLLEQVEQSNSKEVVRTHIQFVRFLAFLNVCADTI